MTQEVIAFPDAESVVISYLKTVIPGLRISTTVPSTRPDSFVTVIRAGGRKVRLNADSAMLIFECWDKDTVKASALCRTVRAYVNALPGNVVNGVWVYKVTEIGGPGYYPDPTTGLPRYQFTVTVDMRGEAI